MAGTFKDYLENEMSGKKFGSFDGFIMEKLGADSAGAASKRLIDIAGNFVASESTIKRWFKIGGSSVPGRDKVIKLAFAMGLDASEADEYLEIGIREPGLLINDYEEIIYMYGLDNHLPYDLCQRMISKFVDYLSDKMEYDHTFSTHTLKREYAVKKNLPLEEFYAWMQDNARFFKGYSRTVMTYMEAYKNQVIKYVRRDAKEALSYKLSETGYALWAEAHGKARENERARITRYLKKALKDGSVSENMAEGISELSKIAHSDLTPNLLLYSEMYISGNGLKPYYDLGNVSKKYLYDMYNFPEIKERKMRTAKALAVLENLMSAAEDSQSVPCPEDIADMIFEYSYGKMKTDNAFQAFSWLYYDEREQRRRLVMPKRENLLPMIHYVAQRRYDEMLEKNDTEYVAKEALAMYHEMAEETLLACEMCRLSDSLALDVALDACFTEDEMYSYRDVLEAMYE